MLFRSRIRRRFETLRRNGVAHVCGRAFGFPGRERVPGADGTRLEVPAEVVVAERAAIRDATAAVLAGASYARVAGEWNAAGLRTAGGKVWIPVLVRDVLSRARNAGLVEHDGVVVGQMPGEPIVARGEFERLRAMLSGRRRGRPPGERYTASGVLRCGLCGRGVTGRPHSGTYPDGARRRQYTCNKHSGGCGGVAADARAVDRELRSFVMRRLSDPRHAAAVAAARARVADRLSAVITEIAECEAIGEALADRLGHREITLAAFDKANQSIAADLVRLGAERDGLTVGEPAGPVAVLDAATVGAQWDAAEPAERRGLLVAALGSLHLVLDPAPKGGRRVFDPARVRLVDPNSA